MPRFYNLQIRLGRLTRLYFIVATPGEEWLTPIPLASRILGKFLTCQNMHKVIFWSFNFVLFSTISCNIKMHLALLIIFFITSQVLSHYGSPTLGLRQFTLRNQQCRPTGVLILIGRLMIKCPQLLRCMFLSCQELHPMQSHYLQDLGTRLQKYWSCPSLLQCTNR